MLLTYKENVHSTQMYIPLKPLFSRHKGIGVQFSDEPTGALDSKTSRDILILLEEINAKYGTTMLIVTHNNSIKNMVHKVLIIKDGLIHKSYENEVRVPARELEDL